MAGEPTITLVGNIGRDPEKSDRYEVVNFTMAVTPRVRRGDSWEDGDPQWYECGAWNALGDNVLEDYAKGDRVMLTGTVLGSRHWESNGREGDSIRVRVEQIGHATPTWSTNRDRNARPKSDSGAQGWYEPGQNAASYDDETPF
jgi:single-strand DNA-binding protein